MSACLCWCRENGNHIRHGSWVEEGAQSDPKYSATSSITKKRGKRLDILPIRQLEDCQVTDWMTRGLDISQTGQLADWTSRGCHQRLCVLSFRLWPSIDVVLSDAVDTFKSRLDKFWQHQDVIYDFKTEIHGTRSRSCYFSPNSPTPACLQRRGRSKEWQDDGTLSRLQICKPLYGSSQGDETGDWTDDGVGLLRVIWLRYSIFSGGQTSALSQWLEDLQLLLIHCRCPVHLSVY